MEDKSSEYNGQSSHWRWYHLWMLAVIVESCEIAAPKKWDLTGVRQMRTVPHLLLHFYSCRRRIEPSQTALSLIHLFCGVQKGNNLSYLHQMGRTQLVWLRMPIGIHFSHNVHLLVEQTRMHQENLFDAHTSRPVRSSTTLLAAHDLFFYIWYLVSHYISQDARENIPGKTCMGGQQMNVRPLARSGSQTNGLRAQRQSLYLAPSQHRDLTIDVPHINLVSSKLKGTIELVPVEQISKCSKSNGKRSKRC